MTDEDFDNVLKQLQLAGSNNERLDKFYEICKFIVCLCGTVLMVLFTVVSLYITFM